MLPYYHVVGDQYLPHVSELYEFRTIQQFKDDMAFFLRSYTPVSQADLLRHLDGADQLPKRCFLPTFDDGFREIHDIIAPFLHTHGIPAIFFLNPSVIDNREMCYPQKKSLLLHALATRPDSPSVQAAAKRLEDAGVPGNDLRERILNVSYFLRHLLDLLAPVMECDFRAYSTAAQPYLSSGQVTELIGRGFAIGAHSVDHPRYPEISLPDQLQQTRQSFDTLCHQFQYSCESFAFPYSDAGVTRDFFEAAFTDPRLKVSFGTGGMLPHFFSNNLERFSMERTAMPAGQIVARQFGRTFIRRPFGVRSDRG